MEEEKDETVDAQADTQATEPVVVEPATPEEVVAPESTEEKAE